MKVITQLVKHFWQRGALGSADMEYLLRHGFVRMRDLPGYAPPAEEAPNVDDTWIEHEIEPPGELEQVEEALLRRRRKAGKGAAKRPAIEIDELRARVRAELARREPALTRLVALAAGQPTSDWRAAAQALRQPSARLQEALARALRGGTLTLRDCWLALDMEPFHRLLPDEELRGRAARAYAALLIAHQPGQLGKYAWILQSDEMQALSNLRIGHGLFLGGLGRMYKSNVRVLTRALDRGSDPVMVWSLVLLHNAHRARFDPRDSRVLREYGPVSRPSDALWQQAWTAALRMDHRRLTEFLVLCYQDGQERADRPTQAMTRDLYCPDGWRLPA
ncbi:MAG: hypothetical protein SFU86_22370 [Pirellulaceae bacterium]|nr:hypothetical protein [Pirellulaceae bacterium]